MKKRFQTGGNIHAVPASRQNAEPRTPSGVRPVSSPVTPVQSDVLGVMKHGGEVKNMKKPKKMAKGGMPAPMPGGFGGGRGAYMGPGADPRPPSMGPGGGRLARQPGGRGVDQGSFMGGPGTYVGPGSGVAPGMGGVKDQPGMRYPMAPTGSFPTGPQAFSPDGARFAQNVGQLRGGFLGGPGGDGAPMFGGMPMGGPGMGAMPRGPGQINNMSNAMMGMMGAGPRAPAMKKGGKVSASSYNDMTGGAGGGIGRLEKTSIAAKTKSQKLKAGGKVKGYYSGGDINKNSSGGDYLSEGDRLAAKKAGIDPNAGTDRSIAMAEYRARQDAAEKRARKPKPSKPASGGAASRSASPDDSARSAARRASALEGAMRGRDDRSSSMTPDDGDMVGPMTPYPSGGRRASSGGKRTPKTTNIDGGASFPIEKRGGSSTKSPLVPGGPLPNPPPDWKSGRKKKESFLERLFRVPTPEERDAAYDKVNKSGMFGGNMYYNTGRLGEGVTGFGKKKGGTVKMAKGGKVENFEGSPKDMAQDRKLAKKYGMTKKAYEKSEIDAKHDKQRSMKGLKMGGAAKMAMGGYAAGGMSTAQDGMKPALRPKPSAMAKGGKAEMHDKGCKCMKCGGVAKYAKGGAVKSGKTFGKPLPGTKTVGPLIRPTVATGASMKKDGMKGQLRAKASGAKPTNMMKPLGMTKMASGGKVRGAGIAQRGTKFIGEV